MSILYFIHYIHLHLLVATLALTIDNTVVLNAHNRLFGWQSINYEYIRYITDNAALFDNLI